ncbi:MAG TPA: hypothetical protein VFH77_00465 [Streptomyces sp.]|nr:hypothetical protein [Streptomyces sp.]
MNMKELALREAELKTFADAVAAELKAVKAEMQTALEESGASQVPAVLDDGTKVATVSLSTPKPTASVVDEDAFTAWVEEHSPDNVQTVTQVRPAYRSALLADMTKARATEWVDTESGEVHEVPGVEIRTGRVTSHSVRLAKDGAEAIVAQWRDRLAVLDLPQITAGRAA